MSPELPPLTVGTLERALQSPTGKYAAVTVVGEVGSTNDDLAAMARIPAGAPGHQPDLSVLIADSQIQGRGRLDRVWEVPAGTSMISSVLLRPEAGQNFPHQGYGWLSLVAAIALVDALVQETGLKAELKWPNDVLIGGRKVAGILAQMIVAPSAPGASRPAAVDGDLSAGGGSAVVVGAGVNVSQVLDQLPVETATSLAIEGGRQLDRNVLLPAYLDRFAQLYLQFCAAGGDASQPLANGMSVRAMAADRMVTLGSAVRAELPGGRSITGQAAGLDHDGSLLITDAAGTTHAVSAGDVIHLRRNGGPHQDGNHAAGSEYA